MTAYYSKQWRLFALDWLCVSALPLAWLGLATVTSKFKEDQMMIRERETVKKFLQYLAAPKFIECMHSLLIFFNFTDLVIDAVVDCGIPGLCYKFNYSCQQASSGSVNSFADRCSKGGKSFKPYGSFRRQCSEHNINMIILIIAIRIWVGGGSVTHSSE